MQFTTLLTGSISLIRLGWNSTTSSFSSVATGTTRTSSPTSNEVWFDVWYNATPDYTPTVVYPSTDGTMKTVDLVLTGAAKNMRYYAKVTDFDYNSSETTTYQPKAAATLYDVTQNLTHCTSDAPTTAADGESLTIKLTAESGYEFGGDTPYIEYENEYGEADTLNFTVATDKQTATATLTVTSAITVVATATAQAAKSYNVTQTLAHCTSDAPTTATDGESLTIKLTAESGYEFGGDTPYIEYENEYGEADTLNFTVATDKQTATATLTVTSAITVVATATTSDYTVTNNILNAAVTAPTTVEQGGAINVTAVANDGYKFDEIPNLVYTDANGETVNVPFTLSSDGLTATLETTAPTADVEKNTLYLVGEAKSTTTVTGYGSINAYRSTLDELNDVAQLRFQRSEDSEGNVSYVDLGQYILKLHRVYCDVQATESDTQIQLGYYQTTVKSSTINNELTVVDFGGVEVPKADTPTAHNTQCDLYLPFVGNISLDYDLINGKTLSLEYHINVLFGDVVALVKIGDTIISRNEGSIKEELLYRAYDNSEYGAIDFNANRLKGFVPTLYLTANESADAQPYANNVRGLVSSFNGYNEFKDIDMTMQGVERSVFDNIVSQLQQGVYISE